MSCLSPIVVRYLDRAQPDPNHFRVDFRTGEFISGVPVSQWVPCGKCVQCRRRVQNDWMLRSVMHSRQFPQGVFATLTYRDSSLPFWRVSDFQKARTKVLRERVPSLRRSDVRSWLKRCRLRFFRYTGKDVSYFYVGEYGPHTNRPHYHIILYGLSLSEFYRFFRSDWERRFGFVRKPRATHFNDGCYSYIGKYCCKPDEFECKFVTLGLVERPRKVASNNFGMWYVYKNMDWHLALGYDNENKRIISFLEQSTDGTWNTVVGLVGDRAVRSFERSFVDFNGFHYAMPRYYHNKIFGNSQDDLPALLFRREKALYGRMSYSESVVLDRAQFERYTPDPVGLLYGRALEVSRCVARERSLGFLQGYYERSFF